MSCTYVQVELWQAMSRLPDSTCAGGRGSLLLLFLLLGQLLMHPLLLLEVLALGG